MSFLAKLQWKAVATLYFVTEVALSTTIRVKKKEKRSTNEFHKVNFLAVKKLINATGCLRGWSGATIHQKHCNVPQEIEYCMCNLL